MQACRSIAYLCLAFMLGSIGYAALICAWTVDALPNQIEARVALVQADVHNQAASLQYAVLHEVDKQATGIRSDARLELASLERQVLDQVAESRELADRRLGDSLGRVDTALSTVAGLRQDLKPILTHVAAVTAHADEASGILLARNALPAQILGVTAAAKVTLGQTAQTMRSIQEATPGILATVKRIGDNSDATTLKTVAAAEESRRLVHNLAENTTPLPKFIRYPAQVIGLLGSAALPVIGIEKLARVDTTASTLVK